VAQNALLRIRKLYEIEAEIKDDPPERKAQIRRQRAGPLLESFHTWLTEVQMQVAPKSAIAKAINYALRRWPSLILYLQEGRLSIDNNAVERALRGVAIGRKNYLFTGNDAGGERAAAFYTLIETCKLNGVEPFTYLSVIVQTMPLLPQLRLSESFFVGSWRLGLDGPGVPHWREEMGWDIPALAVVADHGDGLAIVFDHPAQQASAPAGKADTLAGRKAHHLHVRRNRSNGTVLSGLAGEL